MKFLVTTVEGLEEVSLKEIEDITGNKARKVFPGAIEVEGDNQTIFDLNYRGKTINRVMILLKSGKFEKLEDIYSLAEQVNYSSYIYQTQKFAIRSTRIGEHDFSSMDIERKVGKAVVDSFKKEKGEKLEVDLDNPHLIFRVKVRENKTWIALDTTGKDPLYKRGYRSYDHPASLKPNIANSLIRLSGWNPEKSFLDPMCGSGTIPIEAYHQASKIPNWFRNNYNFWKFYFVDKDHFLKRKKEIDSKVKEETRKIYGFDKTKKHIKGAKRNMEKGRAKVRFIRKNLKEAELDYDYIITNPPCGANSGSKNKAEKVYNLFLEKVDKYKQEEAIIISSASELIPNERIKDKLKFKEGKRTSQILFLS